MDSSNSTTTNRITDPFRIFFPLGIAASIPGVLIWPFFYWGIWTSIPPLQHPRFMIYGFGFAFINGFLGTAWPRFLEAKAIGKSEFSILVGTWLLPQVLCGLGKIQATDIAFSIHALTLFVVLALRFVYRKDKDPLPTGFLVAVWTVFSAFVATLLWGLFPAGLSPFLFVFIKLLLWQGILLIPVLGVGSYLFARILQEPGKKPIVAGRKMRATGVWLSTALIVISFAVEATGSIKTGNLIRFISVTIWLTLAAPAVWKTKAFSTRAKSLKTAIGFIWLSFLIRVFWPGPGYALQHLLFISGIGLAMFIAADRVTLGHSDKLEGLPHRSILWRWLLGIIVLAAATRASADMKASIMISHHIYAALLWVIASVLFWIGIGNYWLLKTGSEK